jgi:hypothetical protein
MPSRKPQVFPFACLLLGVSAAQSAFGINHLMQIEQIIGGVNGDISAQAIQLRMRSGSQNILRPVRIRAHDAAGLNPVLIFDFESCPPASSCIPSSSAGSRILITSAAFNALTTPATVSNFTMTNLIPESYLAAGSLTFESDGGFIYWRVSWGGAAYTGSCTGQFDNDFDANFCPPFAGPLPSCGLMALKFSGTAGALSTNNAAQYALTAGAATFNSNAGTSFTIDATLAGGGKVSSDGDVDGIDFRYFGACLGGPDEAQFGCDCIDSDSDEDVDLFDFAEFQVSFTGP